MPTILAIETAGSSCSAALNINGEVQQLLEPAPRQHARKVMHMVDSLLSSAGLSLSEVDALAFSRGPGSFTGLRIGFGMIQGLAFGADLPVIGVSTLEIMACSAARNYRLKAGDVIIPALDARMSEVFFAIYKVATGGEVDVVVPDCALSPGEAEKLVSMPVAAAVGDGWKLMASEQASINTLNSDFSQDAAALSLLAMTLLSRGEFSAVEDVELAYVRNEISWKKRQKLRVEKQVD